MSKSQKELFVSDLHGGSVSEVYAVTTVALSSYLLYRALDSNAPTIDYVLNCVCVLCLVTIYSDNIGLLHALILVPTILALLNKKKPKRVKNDRNKASVGNQNGEAKDGKSKDESTKNPLPTKSSLPHKPFLTAYRALMLVITNVSILAVDFPLFPRRFAKVETWGTSLMDMGVGSFVFLMGLVLSRAILRSAHIPWGRLITGSIIKALPLLFLGTARCLSVKLLQYQEHMTEYGVHWNFFFTLGLLPIVLAILDPVLRALPRAFVALAISVLYEVILANGGLIYVLRSDNRFDSYISMNKEGLFSFTGYLCIFIIGQSFGSFVLPSRPTENNFLVTSKVKYLPNTEKTEKIEKIEKSSKLAERPSEKPTKSRFSVTTTRGLVYASLFYQILFYLVSTLTYFPSVSRRLANLPYVLWVVSFNAVFLLGYNLIDEWVPSKVGLKVFEAINRNGLFVFLLGNLLTGLVNMSMNTLDASAMTSFVVLVVYTAVFVGVAVELDRRGIYIKV